MSFRELTFCMMSSVSHKMFLQVIEVCRYFFFFVVVFFAGISLFTDIVRPQQRILLSLEFSFLVILL